ncbi:azurin [Paracidovorax valerianellae]|uniref:Azurin n=1 Tax=Paracidovorax valerianellae TaxID=187868 RepID=A0A1G6IAE7_9BURK|nr:azurin [Paracidovorax valerianellae]MDA8447960.1 azurin [Paracidovorax valerianellae]SDC03519.1 azurin [Paracidovorax valerianellae]
MAIATNRLKFAALALVLASGPTWAADCTAEIEGNDAMQFNKATLAVPQSCKQFTVKLKHVGKLPKTAMGHNWVLTKAADLQPVATDGIAAGVAKNYVKDGDARVIAHTKIVGGGESDSVTFSTQALKAGESYAYFCSFPGHSALMKGTLTLAK